MTRIDLVRERFENTVIEDIDQKQAYLDLMILFDEIHDRDILIDDLRDQIAELKKQIK
ncbi:hypothetical protein H6F38_14035 [Paenibacillus sp. EKM208P]|nr:hypothetical protein H6F38_14035 [Paenibacillus sp. EKM208P]